VNPVARLARPPGGAAVSFVLRLEFTQPGGNSGKDVRLLTMGAAKFCGITWQTSETRCIQINSGIDYISRRGAHKIQRGHHYSSWADYWTPRARSPSTRCDGQIKQSVGQIFLRDGASGRSAAIISTGLILALSFGNPVPLGSYLCSLRGGTTADCFKVPIRNFRLIGTLPKH
jgi:hypothetical protein